MECLTLQINVNGSYALFRATSKTCLWASSSWYLVYKMFMEMSVNFQPTHNNHIWKALLVCHGWGEACCFGSICWRNVYTLINRRFLYNLSGLLHGNPPTGSSLPLSLQFSPLKHISVCCSGSYLAVGHLCRQCTEKYTPRRCSSLSLGNTYSSLPLQRGWVKLNRAWVLFS